MRVRLLAVLVGCESATPAAPAASPTPAVAAQPACPTATPKYQDACASDNLHCTYGTWDCTCTHWPTFSSDQTQLAWACSSCVRPDTTKPCTPGDHCEQHNWERDETFTCGADGKWTCGSSSSNSAACAGFKH